MKLHVGGHLAALKIEKLTLQSGQEQKYPFPLRSGPCEPRHRARGSPFTAGPAVLTGLLGFTPTPAPKPDYLGNMNAEGAPQGLLLHHEGHRCTHCLESSNHVLFLRVDRLIAMKIIINVTISSKSEKE